MMRRNALHLRVKRVRFHIVKRFLTNRADQLEGFNDAERNQGGKNCF